MLIISVPVPMGVAVLPYVVRLKVFGVSPAKDLPLPPGWRYIFVEVANDTRVANILDLFAV